MASTMEAQFTTANCTTFFDKGGTWSYFDNCNPSVTSVALLIDWYTIGLILEADKKRARQQLFDFLQAVGA